jgi:TolB-like protein
LKYLTPGSTPGEVKSIAVLPLQNLIGDSEQDYFVEGMHEALIMTLSKISALRVISRTSTDRFKETKKGLPEIAVELGVGALVEGSVFRSDDRIGIRVQLVALDPERNLWSDSIERRFGDVLMLQSEVARAIARNIEVALTPEEEDHLTPARPIDPECYTAYLRGRHHFNNKVGPEKALLAREHFQRAIEIDPIFAPAYVGLSDTFRNSARLGPTSGDPVAREENWNRCRVAVSKALELDNTLGDAHRAMAQLLFVRDWDWLGAEKEFHLALDLDPNDALCHRTYAQLLHVLGRDDEAIDSARRALELDPLSSISLNGLGRALYHSRRYDLSIAEYRKAMELYPNQLNLLSSIGFPYVMNGQKEEARKAWQLFNEGKGRHEIAKAYAESGLEAGVNAYLRMAKGPAPVATSNPSFLAKLHAMLGEKEEAFSLIERALEQHVLVGVSDPLFDSLRSDSRFAELLRKLNLPEEAIQRHLAVPSG